MKHTPVGKGHADCSPSGSYIWMNCPASVTKARGRSRKATIYTREGTAAHHVAEMVLAGDDDIPSSISVEGEVIKVTEEMLDGVQTYVDLVQEAAGMGDLHVEQKVSVDVGGEPLWGTTDAYVIYPEMRRVDIYDLKYGAGVSVTADGSQNRIYGLGVYEAVSPFHEIDYVGLNIIQPRQDNPVRSVVFKVDELLKWKEEKLAPAIAKVETGDTTETAGDHCRWCVRAGECQAFAALAMDKAKVAFGDAPPPMDALSDDDLGSILDHAEIIAAWVTKVRAEASDRIDKGGTVPGWKLVAKRAVRKWVPDLTQDAIKEFMAKGVPVLDIVRIETITTVEKVLKRLRVKASLDPFTVKESSGNTLVSEKDGREAIDTSASGVFGIPM
jgi:hypothetical protein